MRVQGRLLTGVCLRTHVSVRGGVSEVWPMPGIFSSVKY